jgi:hypothetical protein
MSSDKSGQARSDMLARMAATPTRIAAACGARTEAQLRAAPTENEWSAAEILAHLRAADDILAYRAYMMLVRDNPPLPVFDERRWAAVAGYAQLDPHESLRAFTLRRTELLAMLRAAAPDDWQRTGVHEQRGAVTILDMLRVLVEHEEEHCAQLEAI